MPEVVTCEHISEKKQLVLGLSEDYETGSAVTVSSSTSTESSNSSSDTTVVPKKVGRTVNVGIFSKFEVELRGEFNNKKMQVKLRVLF